VTWEKFFVDINKPLDYLQTAIKRDRMQQIATFASNILGFEVENSISQKKKNT